MRSRAPLFALLLVIGSFALPLAAHAGGIPFFGPIIDGKILDQTCPLGWGAIITVINNIISLLLTLAIVLVAPLTIAYAGFLYVVNPMDPGGVSKAKGILTNTIVGLIIALASWMIVDAIMAVLYHPTDPSLAGKTWSSLITGNTSDACLKVAGALDQSAGQTTPGVVSGGVVYSGATAQCAVSNSACSPSALQSAGFNQTQANVMSCIAVTESSGIFNTPPYNTTHPGSNSTACGTFQITQTTWNKYATGACANFSNCTDPACNIQVARTLVANNGYNDWTCTNCNSNAAACIQKYSP